MKHTITTLELIAGMNVGKEHKEAYFDGADHGTYEFIRVKVETCGEKTFEFNLLNPEGEHLGRLEFDREQAYFLHGWLTALIGATAVDCSAKNNGA